MTLTIELSPQEEAQLLLEARREGLDAATLAKKFVLANLTHVEQDKELINQWKKEDAAATSEEREADRQIWEAFEQGINETRQSLGMRQL